MSEMRPSNRLLGTMHFIFFASLVCLVGLSYGRQQYRSRIPNGNAIPCPPGDTACEENELCVGFGHESCAGGAVTPRLNVFGKVHCRQYAQILDSG